MELDAIEGVEKKETAAKAISRFLMIIILGVFTFYLRYIHLQTHAEVQTIDLTDTGMM